MTWISAIGFVLQLLWAYRDEIKSVIYWIKNLATESPEEFRRSIEKVVAETKNLPKGVSKEEQVRAAIEAAKHWSDHIKRAAK